MSDLKDLSVKTFLTGSIATILLAIGKYIFTNSGIIEIAVPSFVIFIMIFFVSVLMFDSAEKKEKERKKQNWRQEIEKRIEKLEDDS